ncbi:hypothetical protein DFQ01_10823 [Paenibacillus cellulosilyticus]|uniref:Uncharacterized protein n=1 Tax=Paenibacillus cellulosilyticus TaxID=375489 RepID=A0A2V2YTD2_9BACL|nr:hypothetical protein [Paenibacillus cellulosilyticus]PWW02748.1 hypothetical protein DFQ01_10823 [Paenibacillus cellulosilyticus]QKS43503.1 hypothetical protein HUB94_15455 [Paenibacillus cellulosilyticus]
MQEVYPISHHTVYPYIGRRVSAVTQDGRHFIGTIKGVADGKLMLEDCTLDSKPLLMSSVHSKKQTRTMHKARLSGYYDGYGGGYGGGCGGFDGGCFFFPFAILASLFILPFFCI